ncbi:protein held out wings-like isoform X2 [Portunus trituberculatus]|uniref:protein held out wings-like isoform X2 n=1 Tax=Portunus trituberculatus TaxID=210409 RepID=UPI001E1CFC3F|nr:protein held out wings-like isoform X2 [Portunus trituberculatus]
MVTSVLLLRARKARERQTGCPCRPLRAAGRRSTVCCVRGVLCVMSCEINKVRSSLFQINGGQKEPLSLPEPVGPTVTLSDKVYVPVKDHPEFNFVGRILGPRGMTAKQLEQETGCKIMVRGKGSMRDKKKEEQNRGKPNWEHLNEDLHVLISVEDSENRAKMKIQRALEEIRKLLVPSADGEDELKKRQLMELAIINGTYRDSSMAFFASAQSSHYNGARLYPVNEIEGLGPLTGEVPRLLTPGMTLPSPLRTATPLGGHPLIMPTRIPVPTTTALLNGTSAGMPPPLIAAGDAPAGLMYAPYAAEYANYAALSSPLLTEYPPDATGVAVKQRRHLGQAREHPYQRTGTLS